MKCKICGKNSESEYCFQHKPRKPLINTLFQRKNVTPVHKKQTNKEESSKKLREFFADIWKKRNIHVCENCGKWLGKEPRTYMFDHLLEKSKHPDLTFEEDNIMLVCLECHDNKTRGNLTKFVRDKIEEIRKRFLK